MIPHRSRCAQSQSIIVMLQVRKPEAIRAQNRQWPISVVICVTALLILKLEIVDAARWLWEIIPNRPAWSILSIEPEGQRCTNSKGGTMAERTGTAMQRAQEPVAITPAGSQSLLERMDEVFNEISKRAFEMFDGNGRVFGRELDDWLKAEREILHPVQVRLSESGDSFEVKAEVPGFTEKELEISAEPGRVTISGKQQGGEEGQDSLFRDRIRRDSACCRAANQYRYGQDHGNSEEWHPHTSPAESSQCSDCTHSTQGAVKMPRWTRPRAGWNQHVPSGRGLIRICWITLISLI